MKKKIMIFILFFSLIITSISYSKDNEYIAFSQSDAKRLVVELEKIELTNQNLTIAEKEIIEYVKQVDILKDQLKLTKEQLESANNLIKKNEELYNLKEKSLENNLKEASKPKWDLLFGSFGLGAVVTLTLILIF